MRRHRLPRLLVAVAILTSSVVAGPAAHAAGRFSDDDGNVHEGNIEAVAAAGIAKGCNPPLNNLYCPFEEVTRGQMAAFLNRALGLPATAEDFFTDDEDSVFEDDINRLAEAGITTGCATALFCPDDSVTRGQMAAFLDRAFDLADTAQDFFTDDDGSIFEENINRLAAEGITLGCNPPDNDEFCRNEAVRRDQMASFLARALGLDPIFPSANCTEVIGFSQTGQWFASAAFDLEPWQARIQSGANLEKWTNPDFGGWNAAVRGRDCDREEVDRVIFTISPDSPTPEGIAGHLETVIGVIRAKYPAVDLILLQPVVGAPNDGQCPNSTAGSIRATLRHPRVDAAIPLVIGGDVIAGASPEVGSCAHYSDGIGHLTAEGAEYVGAQLADYYG